MTADPLQDVAVKLMSQEVMRKELKVLMNLPENLVCADCKDKRPMWASLIVPPPDAPFETIGVFCCFQCSGAHRRMGTHICFVRSTNLDEWKESEIRAMQNGGNKLINALFEATLKKKEKDNVKPNNRTKMDKRVEFIFDKYQHRKWYNISAYEILSNHNSVSKLSVEDSFSQLRITSHENNIDSLSEQQFLNYITGNSTASTAVSNHTNHTNHSHDWWKGHSEGGGGPTKRMSNDQKQMLESVASFANESFLNFGSTPDGGATPDMDRANNRGRNNDRSKNPSRESSRDRQEQQHRPVGRLGMGDRSNLMTTLQRKESKRRLINEIDEMGKGDDDSKPPMPNKPSSVRTSTRRGQTSRNMRRVESDIGPERPKIAKRNISNETYEKNQPMRNSIQKSGSDGNIQEKRRSGGFDRTSLSRNNSNSSTASNEERRQNRISRNIAQSSGGSKNEDGRRPGTRRRISRSNSQGSSGSNDGVLRPGTRRGVIRNNSYGSNGSNEGIRRPGTRRGVSRNNSHGSNASNEGIRRPGARRGVARTNSHGSAASNDEIRRPGTRRAVLRNNSHESFDAMNRPERRSRGGRSGDKGTDRANEREKGSHPRARSVGAESARRGRTRNRSTERDLNESGETRTASTEKDLERGRRKRDGSTEYEVTAVERGGQSRRESLAKNTRRRDRSKSVGRRHRRTPPKGSHHDSNAPSSDEDGTADRREEVSTDGRKKSSEDEGRNSQKSRENKKEYISRHSSTDDSTSPNRSDRRSRNRSPNRRSTAGQTTQKRAKSLTSKRIRRSGSGDSLDKPVSHRSRGSTESRGRPHKPSSIRSHGVNRSPKTSKRTHSTT